MPGKSVKFGTGLSGQPQTWSQDEKPWPPVRFVDAHTSALGAPTERTCRPYSNYRSSKPGSTCNYRITDPSLIRTGQFVGLPIIDRREDRTRILSCDQVRDTINAGEFARRRAGKPLNALLTVAWQKTPLWSPDKWSALQTRFMQEITRWLRRGAFGRPKVETAFVWVRERARNRGAHTHFAIHLGGRPPAVAKALIGYLATKFAFEKNGIQIDYGDYGAKTVPMQNAIIKYLLKGMNHERRYYSSATHMPLIGEVLKIDDEDTQGIVRIKRAGTSQNIGHKARYITQWKDQWALPKLAALIYIKPDEPGAKKRAWRPMEGRQLLESSAHRWSRFGRQAVWAGLPSPPVPHYPPDRTIW